MQDGALVALAVTSSYSSSDMTKHGIGIFAELHQIGHAADEASVFRQPKRRLVDRT